MFVSYGRSLFWLRVLVLLVVAMTRSFVMRVSSVFICLTVLAIVFHSVNCCLAFRPSGTMHARMLLTSWNSYPMVKMQPRSFRVRFCRYQFSFILSQYSPKSYFYCKWVSLQVLNFVFFSMEISSCFKGKVKI